MRVRGEPRHGTNARPVQRRYLRPRRSATSTQRQKVLIQSLHSLHTQTFILPPMEMISRCGFSLPGYILEYSPIHLCPYHYHFNYDSYDYYASRPL